MKQHFLTAALAACTLNHIIGPAPLKHGWQIVCHDDRHKEYLKLYPKHKSRAIGIAKKWLADRPRGLTAPWQELKNK